MISNITPPQLNLEFDLRLSRIASDAERLEKVAEKMNGMFSNAQRLQRQVEEVSRVMARLQSPETLCHLSRTIQNLEKNLRPFKELEKKLGGLFGAQQSLPGLAQSPYEIVEEFEENISRTGRRVEAPITVPKRERQIRPRHSYNIPTPTKPKSIEFERQSGEPKNPYYKQTTIGFRAIAEGWSESDQLSGCSDDEL